MQGHGKRNEPRIHSIGGGGEQLSHVYTSPMCAQEPLLTTDVSTQPHKAQVLTFQGSAGIFIYIPKTWDHLTSHTPKGVACLPAHFQGVLPTGATPPHSVPIIEGICPFKETDFCLCNSPVNLSSQHTRSSK